MNSLNQLIDCINQLINGIARLEFVARAVLCECPGLHSSTMASRAYD